MPRVVYNPGPDAVIYTADGRQLDADSSVEVPIIDPLLQRLIDRGSLLDKGAAFDPYADAEPYIEPEKEG